MPRGGNNGITHICKNNIIKIDFFKEEKGNERKSSRSSISLQGSTQTSPALNDSDLAYLRRKTRFTKQEIKEWFEYVVK